MQVHALPPSTTPHNKFTIPSSGKRARPFTSTRHKRQNAISQGNYLEAAGQRAATDFVLVAILQDSCVVKPNVVTTIHLAPPPQVKPKLAPLVAARTSTGMTLSSPTLTTHHTAQRSAITSAESAAVPRLNVPQSCNTINDSATVAAGSPYSLTPTATLVRFPSSLLGSNEPTPLADHKVSHRSDASSTLTPGKHAVVEQNNSLRKELKSRELEA